MSLFYADTSAVIKLLVEEAHSTAFAAFYDAHADAEWVSSPLFGSKSPSSLCLPCLRCFRTCVNLLSAFSSIAIDDDIVEGAMNEPDRSIRSLEAIHLATARVPTLWNEMPLSPTMTGFSEPPTMPGWSRSHRGRRQPEFSQVPLAPAV